MKIILDKNDIRKIIAVKYGVSIDNVELEMVAVENSITATVKDPSDLESLKKDNIDPFEVLNEMEVKEARKE